MAVKKHTTTVDEKVRFLRELGEQLEQERRALAVSLKEILNERRQQRRLGHVQPRK